MSEEKSIEKLQEYLSEYADKYMIGQDDYYLLKSILTELKEYREAKELCQGKGTVVEAHLRAKIAYAKGTIKGVRDSGHCPVSMQNALDFLEEE
ncbi:MAG: hypothetical protein KAR06_06845 [Deltaproteobacteria bacterium]|nr:hypothetical protein [Deltaproteobacteria bacterium]